MEPWMHFITFDVSWTPQQIPLEGWWDGSDASTITESSGKVSQLDDKSGNDEHMVQATGSNQPATGTRTLNGLNFLDFDSDDFLENGTFPLTGGDIAIFAVVEIDAISSASDSVFSMDASSAPDFEFDAQNASQFNGRIDGNDGIGADVNLTGGPFSGPSIYNLNFDKTGAGIYNAFIDGIQRAVDTTYSIAMGTSMRFRLMTSRGSNQTPEGALAEVVTVSDFTADTRYKIEGYLAHKWGTTAKLPYNHPHKYFPPIIGQLSLPLFIPSNVTLIGWFDTSDESSITESSGAVSQIDDLAGTEHMVQATGSDQPTTGTRTINGLNVFDCDGDRYVENLTFPVASGNVAIFVIAEVDTITNSSESIISCDVSGGNDWQLEANNGSAFNGEINVTNMGADVVLTSGPFAGPSIYNVNMDKTGAGIYNCFVDGTQRAANTTYSTAMTTPTELRFMMNRNELQGINGAHGEAVLTSDFTTATREKIEGYLAWKWGLLANLPSGHPYFKRPPVA